MRSQIFNEFNMMHEKFFYVFCKVNKENKNWITQLLKSPTLSLIVPRLFAGCSHQLPSWLHHRGGLWLFSSFCLPGISTERTGRWKTWADTARCGFAAAECWGGSDVPFARCHWAAVPRDGLVGGSGMLGAAPQSWDGQGVWQGAGVRLQPLMSCEHG